jgi:homogentisate 1,2-dioxygenase
LVNKDCTIVWLPEIIAQYFYKNADADEMIFIHKGKLRNDGNIPFEYGDYLIPRGIIYKLILIPKKDFCSLLLLLYPKRYKTNQDNI